MKSYRALIRCHSHHSFTLFL